MCKCFYLFRPEPGSGRGAERSRILGVFHSVKFRYLCLSLQYGTSCHPLECLPFWGCFAARVTLASGLLPALHSLDACEGLTRAISTGYLYLILGLAKYFGYVGEKKRLLLPWRVSRGLVGDCRYVALRPLRGESVRAWLETVAS
ncbi:hypothetical protein ACLB2K_046920 [Fragaria x ananassa]